MPVIGEVKSGISLGFTIVHLRHRVGIVSRGSFVDRRTALSGMLGVAGAGVALTLSRRGLSSNDAATKGAPAQPPLRQSGTGNFKSVTLAQVPLGGGGFVTGIDISTDGSRMACRTDVTNAYVRDMADNAWRPLFSPSTMKTSDSDPLPELNGKAEGLGAAGIRIAPSNRDVIYASFRGYVWRSIDGGKSIQRTNLPQKTMFTNSGWQRLFNRTIDVHSRDPNRVIVGTWGDGVWHSADGGNAWGRSDLPISGKSRDNQPGIYLVAYDPTARDRVYVFVTAVGLFKSDSGPSGEFQILAGGPLLCSSLVMAPDGTVFLCEQTANDKGGKVFRYSPSNGWATGTPDQEMLVAAVDPRNPAHLVACNPNGYLTRSEDGGKSFVNVGMPQWGSPRELSWARDLDRLFPAQMLIDPNQPDRLWFAQGLGVAKAQASGSGYIVNDLSAGIEELCVVGVMSVPGGGTFISAWDKPFWRIDDLTAYNNRFQYPLPPGKSHDNNTVTFASYMDFAGDDPRFLVGVVASSDISGPGISVNGGDSWQVFAGSPATGWGHGGCIAASTRKNIVLLPSNNGVGIYTKDGGLTWRPIKLDGVNATDNFANAYYVQRKNISADKTRPGTFVLVYTVVENDAFTNPLGGVWLTRDGGSNWQQVLSGVISTENHDPEAVRLDHSDWRQFWQCQLEFVPGFAGELLYTPHADGAADRFFWSRDDGRTWTEAHRKVRNVSAFGFGKAAPERDRPTVYFWGEVDGKQGLYVTLDWFTTAPRLLSRFPSQMLAEVSAVAGDPDRFGRAFVGTKCAGSVRIDVEI